MKITNLYKVKNAAFPRIKNTNSYIIYRSHSFTLSSPKNEVFVSLSLSSLSFSLLSSHSYDCPFSLYILTFYLALSIFLPSFPLNFQFFGTKFQQPNIYAFSLFLFPLSWFLILSPFPYVFLLFFRKIIQEHLKFSFIISHEY